MDIGKHKAVRIQGEEMRACYVCGIFLCGTTTELPCPPWSATGEGEITNANRAHEAGELEELKRMHKLAHGLFVMVNDSDVNELTQELYDGLERLVQKREGLARS